MKFTKRGKIVLAIILIVGLGGAFLNLITGHGASNRGLLVAMLVSLGMYFGLRVWEQ